MFKRRTPLTKVQALREILWPSMEWARFFSYIRHRATRLTDTSRKIAAGLAFGAAISFTPLVGTHFIQAGALAYITRANVPASLIGTFIGNPWTFPFMWWAAISLGSFLLNAMGIPASTALPEALDLGILWNIMLDEPLRVFLPWLLGGYLLAAIVWPIFFVIFLNIVRAGKTARRKAKTHKMHKSAQEITKSRSE